MNPQPAENKPRRVAVIGGGITGLAAAHRLTELDASLEVTLFEAGDRLGGILQTERRDSYLVEHAADMFTTREPWALDLCKRIGFDDQLIPTNDQNRRAFIVRRGQLYEVPEGFSLLSPIRVWPVLSTPLLSIAGKMRLAWEYFIPARKGDADESLTSFATRRLGRETFERIVQPLVSGIYTADPNKLSMAATMSQFVAMERNHGGLIRGAKKTVRAVQAERSASGARYGNFLAPRDGMSSFIAAIAARLPAGCVRLNSPLERLAQTEEGRWELTIDNQPATETFDGVIIAIGAPKAAKLLASVNQALSNDLAAIPHAGAAIVVAAYRKDQFKHPLNGFGFVVPMVEKRRILAGSFASVKFSGRAPDDCILTRTFVGGACQPELVDLPDEEIETLVSEELNELLGLAGQPIFREIIRWRGAMPQYHVGHLDLVEKIESQTAELDNLELAGNAYRGVGIPFCVHSAEQAVDRLYQHEAQASVSF